MSTPSRRLSARRCNKGMTIGDELEPGIRLPHGMSAENTKAIIQSFFIRENDVFVVTYPKCGTTWMQQIVKLVWNNGIEDGRDIDEALPWIESMILGETELMKSPRGFKTHLCYQWMPGGDPILNKQAKYIYVYRNPKDVAVSLYHHSDAMKYIHEVVWDEFFEDFISGHVIYGSYFKHILGWWKHKDAENILIISYEQMKRDPYTAISNVGSFLGYQLNEYTIQQIIEQTNFDKMKLNLTANHSWMDEYRKSGATPFMRKGVIGDWKNYFSKEQSIKIDKLVAKNMAETDLVYDFGD